MNDTYWEEAFLAGEGATCCGLGSLGQTRKEKLAAKRAEQQAKRAEKKAERQEKREEKKEVRELKQDHRKQQQVAQQQARLEKQQALKEARLKQQQERQRKIAEQQAERKRKAEEQKRINELRQQCRKDGGRWVNGGCISKKAAVAPPATSKPGRPAKPDRVSTQKWQREQNQLQRACGNFGGSWRGQAAPTSRELWGCTFKKLDGSTAVERTVGGIRSTGQSLRQALRQSKISDRKDLREIRQEQRKQDRMKKIAEQQAKREERRAKQAELMAQRQAAREARQAERQATRQQRQETRQERREERRDTRQGLRQERRDTRLERREERIDRQAQKREERRLRQERLRAERQARQEERRLERQAKIAERQANKAEAKRLREIKRLTRKCGRQGGTYDPATGVCTMPDRPAYSVWQPGSGQPGGTIWQPPTQEPEAPMIQPPQYIDYQYMTDPQVQQQLQPLVYPDYTGGGSQQPSTPTLEPLIQPSLEPIDMDVGGGYGGGSSFEPIPFAPGETGEEAPIEESALPPEVGPSEMSECGEAVQMALPLEYADQYGMMKVLEIHCATATGAAPTSGVTAPGSMPVSSAFEDVSAVETGELEAAMYQAPMFGLADRI